MTLTLDERISLTWEKNRELFHLSEERPSFRAILQPLGLFHHRMDGQSPYDMTENNIVEFTMKTGRLADLESGGRPNKMMPLGPRVLRVEGRVGPRRVVVHQEVLRE